MSGRSRTVSTNGFMASVPIAISPPLPTVTRPVVHEGIEDQLSLVLEPLGLGQFEAGADVVAACLHIVGGLAVLLGAGNCIFTASAAPSFDPRSMVARVGVGGLSGSAVTSASRSTRHPGAAYWQGPRGRTLQRSL